MRRILFQRARPAFISSATCAPRPSFVSRFAQSSRFSYSSWSFGRPLATLGHGSQNTKFPSYTQVRGLSTSDVDDFDDIDTDDDDDFHDRALEHVRTAQTVAGGTMHAANVDKANKTNAKKAKEEAEVDQNQSEDLREFYDGREAATGGRPLRYRDLHDETLISLCVAKDFSAIKERLIRSIIAADGKSRLDAKITAFEMYHYNVRYNFIYSLPHITGFVLAVVAAAVSIPMVFSTDLAIWFNERFVTTDVPPPEDMDTPLEVSIWTWSWMEPIIGIASFLLLSMQLARAQMVKMHWLPWTERVLKRRSRHLRQKYPKYPASIVRDFSYACPLAPRFTALKAPVRNPASSV